MLELLFKGLLVGLVVAIPVGPVGLMCLETTVSRGKKPGFVCACGMVVADIFSSIIMLIGLGMLYESILSHRNVFQIITGSVFAALGGVIILARRKTPKPSSKRALIGLFITSFLLSVSPATFAFMLYLFPALNLTGQGNYPIIVLGVATGSAAWCALVLGSGSFIRSCLGDRLVTFKTIVGSLFILIGSIGIISALL